MNANGWFQIFLYAAVVLLLTRPLGGWLHQIYSAPAPAAALRGEGWLYRLCGVQPQQEQDWRGYTFALLMFNVLGFALLYTLLRCQQWLPLNPQNLAGLSSDIAFNVAVSFVTNTNWQSYAGESTLSYGSQMLGLTVQNFVSAATGIAVALALIRGLARRNTASLGNFWVDLTRSTLYVLLPLSLITALVLVTQGVPQNFMEYTSATTLEGAQQLIAQGPVASQIAIKQIGSNGGGFFNANSAHPFENPTALSNFLESFFLIMLAAALTNTFGRMVKNEKQGWALFGAMGIMLLVGMALTYWAEAGAQNWEGKEVRFGFAQSSIWAVATTAASNGSVNAMHDSFTPLGGMMPLLNMLLGEVIFGGVGAGLYGMLMFALIAVFMAGLMVGRTPEYLGKKIEAVEIRWCLLALLSVPMCILGFTALAVVMPAGLKGLLNAGPHGFTEILYAYTSAAANNGSAFAGLSANSPFYNITLGISMLVGRFGVIIPMLAVAGSLAHKKSVPPSPGTLPTDSGLFVALLIAVVSMVGGLTFAPALVLGPVAEHFALAQNLTY